MFLTTGGAFKFDPSDPESDPPVAVGSVVGATDNYKKWNGATVKIKTILRREDNPLGVAILEVKVKRS